MNRDIRLPEFSYERLAAVPSLALFATALWWAIFHWGGLMLGVTGDANWLAPVLAAIFALLMLGLGSAASGADVRQPVPVLGLAHVSEAAKRHQSWRNSSTFRVNRRMSRLRPNSP